MTHIIQDMHRVSFIFAISIPQIIKPRLHVYQSNNICISPWTFCYKYLPTVQTVWEKKETHRFRVFFYYFLLLDFIKPNLKFH